MYVRSKTVCISGYNYHKDNLFPFKLYILMPIVLMHHRAVLCKNGLSLIDTSVKIDINLFLSLNKTICTSWQQNVRSSAGQNQVY